MKPVKLESDIVTILTDRLNDEFSASYFYKACANWCKNNGYFKAAEYFNKESSNELVHAQKIQDFLTDWNVVPDLLNIPKPEINFASLKDIIEKAYVIEYKLYEDYEDNSVTIFKTGDICVFDFLQQYRTIQQQSVAEYSDMISVLDGVEASKMNLLLLEETLFGD